MRTGKSTISTLSENTWITLGSACAVLGAVVLIVFYAAALRAENTANALQGSRSESRINKMEEEFAGVKEELGVVRRSVVRQETMLEFLVKEQKK